MMLLRSPYKIALAKNLSEKLVKCSALQLTFHCMSLVILFSDTYLPCLMISETVSKSDTVPNRLKT